MVSFVKTNVHDDLNETERIVSFISNFRLGNTDESWCYLFDFQYPSKKMDRGLEKQEISIKRALTDRTQLKEKKNLDEDERKK